MRLIDGLAATALIAGLPVVLSGCDPGPSIEAQLAELDVLTAEFEMERKTDSVLFALSDLSMQETLDRPMQDGSAAELILAWLQDEPLAELAPGAARVLSDSQLVWDDVEFTFWREPNAREDEREWRFAGIWRVYAFATIAEGERHFVCSTRAPGVWWRRSGPVAVRRDVDATSGLLLYSFEPPFAERDWRRASSHAAAAAAVDLGKQIASEQLSEASGDRGN